MTVPAAGESPSAVGAIARLRAAACRPSVRRPLRGAVVIVGALAVLGVCQGLLWAAVAPGQQAKVFTDGSYGSLPTADYHPFVDLAIFVLMGVVIGVVAATLAWRVRAIRGTITLLALVGGCALGAYIAYKLGPALVSGIDPATVGKTGSEHVVTAAPKLGTALVIAGQPAIAAAVYTFLVAWNGNPGLAREDQALPAAPDVPAAKTVPAAPDVPAVPAGPQESVAPVAPDVSAAPDLPAAPDLTAVEAPVSEA